MADPQEAVGAVRPTPGPEAVRLNLTVARWSVGTALFLGLLKVGAAVATGSLSILASLVDSVMDVFASVVNLLAVRWAGRPADEDHAYGHGKAEALAGLVQTVVVGFSGVFLLVEGIRRLVEGIGVAHTGLGIAVMAISTVASWAITRVLRSTARRTGSLALAADAVHYASDVWTNLGVLGALVAVRWTGLSWLDGAVAVAVALVVLRTAVQVLRRSSGELMDESLDPVQVAGLVAHVGARVPEIHGLHEVRTRQAGPTVFVDCRAKIDSTLSFVAAHALAERVRAAIEEAIPGAIVVVHPDPYPLLPADEPP